MEQEILNEQELPEEGALNNGAAEPEANGAAAAEETNNATAEHFKSRDAFSSLVRE